jgi:hypothetical protein
MESEADKLRAEVRRYDKLRSVNFDVPAREALDFLITKAEARLREIKATTAKFE